MLIDWPETGITQVVMNKLCKPSWLLQYIFRPHCDKRVLKAVQSSQNLRHLHTQFTGSEETSDRKQEVHSPVNGWTCAFEWSKLKDMLSPFCMACLIFLLLGNEEKLQDFASFFQMVDLAFQGWNFLTCWKISLAGTWMPCGLNLTLKTVYM